MAPSFRAHAASAPATPGATGSGQSLAHTGAQVAPIAAVVGAAVAVLVGGGLILLVRRRARQRA
ncbi:LPXTG cell wall anchor domain-containing protein [Microbacterium sp. KSW2-21]|uniref:LPXTG cell wall anchor domain-containing protein n=1 Tax=Microbacterium algihabitans TaxID=3075992 RepID=A0ABU3RV80_9MICO|nr:LPXTG cell wall anchor domain-containing protein [Microbacterium sp. KSW2-21]MDU0326806.1 LPXTG cell wall anchor domain-containing protein [Microbacterium sp. KSW2-21]